MTSDVARQAPAQDPQPVEPAQPGAERPRSLGRDAMAELVRRPIFVVSAFFILMFVTMSLAPFLFSSKDGTDRGNCNLLNSRLPPSSKAWFGFDSNGCDVYAQVIYGARISIIVGVVTTLVAALVGGLLGTLAGYYGGMVDSVIGRLADVFFGIPAFLGALLVLVSFPSDETTPAWLTVAKVVLALAILGWPSFLRIMRSSVLQVKSADYVQAARALGASGPRIIWKHVVPNAIAPLIVLSTISLGGYIGAEAALSYLGVGLQAPVVSWGVMINDAQNYVRVAQHMLLFPAGALSLCVLAFIMLGDVVRDALDPKLR